MKLYKNPCLSLPVRNCEECPNRIPERIKTKKSFSTRFVCRAITRKSIHAITPENPLGEIHPLIEEARFYGGFLPDCPLKNKEEAEA